MRSVVFLFPPTTPRLQKTLTIGEACARVDGERIFTDLTDHTDRGAGVLGGPNLPSEVPLPLKAGGADAVRCGSIALSSNARAGRGWIFRWRIFRHSWRIFRQRQPRWSSGECPTSSRRAPIVLIGLREQIAGGRFAAIFGRFSATHILVDGVARHLQYLRRRSMAHAALVQRPDRMSASPLRIAFTG